MNAQQELKNLFQWHIYALKNPDTEDVGYIGKSYDVKTRFKQHLCDNTGTRKAHWINSLKKEGKKPVLIILESDYDDIKGSDAERKWIKYYRTLTTGLLNSKDGGGKCAKRINRENQRAFQLLVDAEFIYNLKVISAKIGETMTAYIVSAVKDRMLKDRIEETKGADTPPETHQPQQKESHHGSKSREEVRQEGSSRQEERLQEQEVRSKKGPGKQSS